MARRHAIHLTPDQRETCRRLLRDARAVARTKRRALVLLQADHRHGLHPRSDAEIAEAAGVNPRTVARTRAAFLSGGLAPALCLAPQKRNPPPKLSSEHRRRVLALAATPPPPGYPRWTTRTLADHLNRSADFPPVSRELIRRLLKGDYPPASGGGARGRAGRERGGAAPRSSNRQFSEMPDSLSSA